MRLQYVIHVVRENDDDLIIGPYLNEWSALYALECEPGQEGCPYDWGEDCLDAFVYAIEPPASYPNPSDVLDYMVEWAKELTAKNTPTEKEGE